MARPKAGDYEAAPVSSETAERGYAGASLSLIAKACAFYEVAVR